MEETKSLVVKSFESTYGVSLTNCSRNTLNKLILSEHPRITKISDIMLDNLCFDTDAMTDIEKKNIKYLILSSKETMRIINTMAQCVYYQKESSHLRSIMSLQDFINSCFEKFLSKDNILKYNANYNFECAILCWIKRNAIWKSVVKSSEEKPILNDDTKESKHTMDTYSFINYNDDVTTSLEVSSRIAYILNNFSTSTSNKYLIKSNNKCINYSDYSFAYLFIKCRFTKKELSKMIYNKSNNKLVSNPTFNKLYSDMIKNCYAHLKTEFDSVGEKLDFSDDCI